jgi:hypothetical protein
MAAVLKIIDEHFGSDTPKQRSGGELRLVSERTTPREIISRRVEQEVAELNEMGAKSSAIGASRSFIVDVGSQSSEALLNKGSDAKRPLGLIDAAAETARALTAFENRAFIMLVDERQAEDPDAPITVRPGSEIVFLYLTPLKGG